MANRKHKLLLNDVEYIDEDRTFNAVATSSHGAFAPFNVTARVYDDTSLAKKIHEITNRVNEVSVARSIYPHFRSSGSARLVFEPFYAKTFTEWANSLLGIQEKKTRDEKINKAFRSIINGIDSLYFHRHYDIGLDLEECICIDDEDNAQIVLDQKGTDNMELGAPKDIKAFKILVDRVFDANESDGYNFFLLLDSHFTGRGDSHQLNNGCLRSYSYFILHNALFYDARDRYRCIYKMIMFRDMDQIDFNGRMFSKSNPHIAQWSTKIPEYGVLRDCFKTPNDYEMKYSKEESILEFFSNCYKHMQDSESGLVEIQSELDRVLPNVIFPLFYNFVEQIEAKKDFHGYQVLEYFMKINPSPDFLD